MVTIKKIQHREAPRIGIYFGYDDQLKQSAKGIGARWSHTLRCWYVDYNTENFHKIKHTFPEVEIVKDPDHKVSQPAPGLQKSHDTAPIVADKNDNALSLHEAAEHNPPKMDEPVGARAEFLHITGKYWIVKVPYNQTIIKALKASKGVYWNKSHKAWMIFRYMAVKTKVEAILGQPGLLPAEYFTNETPSVQHGEIVVEPSARERKMMMLLPETDVEILKKMGQADFSTIEKDKTASQKDEPKNREESNSDSTIKKNAPRPIDVLCNEKEKTFYLTLPFALKEQFKKLEGAWWHPKLKQWSALDNEENREQLKAVLQQSGLSHEFIIAGVNKQSKVKTPRLDNPVMPDEKFIRHMQIEGKAKSTIKQYSWYIKWFLTMNRHSKPDENSGEMVQCFLHDEVLKRGYGKTSQNLALTALQNYYRIIYNIDLHAEAIPRAKQKRPLPKVLSEEEFLKIYKQCDNKKHQIILKLMYGCGLRRDEVCSLKTEDVNIDRELIFVKGKGGKYRPVNPGKKLIEDIKGYLEFAKPGEYFIEGQNKGKYSGTSIAKIVERLSEKAGIKRNVTPHMFRHTFATHHMEKGTELRLIQEALGHASSKTTEIYTRVSRNNIKKMRNLLDDMEI